jgi:hypothetical protein
MVSEMRGNEEEARSAWDSMVTTASGQERLRGMAEAMISGGPPPSGPDPELTAPLIVDTDVGGDPTTRSP